MDGEMCGRIILIDLTIHACMVLSLFVFICLIYVRLAVKGR